jgi:hypothetical protein
MHLVWIAVPFGLLAVLQSVMDLLLQNVYLVNHSTFRFWNGEF